MPETVSNVSKPMTVHVIEVKRKKQQKGKRRYSPGLLYGVGVLEHRLLGGMARGARTYLKRSNESAATRRDGALRDFGKNASRAIEKGAFQVVRIPRDVVDSPPFKRGWKTVRRVSRIVVF
jgi:hypothetical protein